jgi:hypothetical protein
MQTFLYNLNTQQREGPIREGRYLVDGQPGPLPDYLVELEIVVVVPDPPYNPATQTLEHRSYPDLVNNKWYEENYVRDLTEEEIQQRLAKPPNSCTPRQLRLALIQSGISLSAVQGFIDGIADPIQKEIAIVEWEYALEIVKEHPLVQAIAVNLNLSEQQVDNIFTLAVTL